MSVATLTSRTKNSPSKAPAPANELITGDVFATLDSLGHAELEEGVIIEMPPPGYIHGLVEFELGRLLGNFVRQHQLGYIVGGETGFYVSRDPDTVRAVDVAFISNERMATAEHNQPYLTQLPELIIEVMSPHDRWPRVAKKLDEYFAGGRCRCGLWNRASSWCICMTRQLKQCA